MRRAFFASLILWFGTAGFLAYRLYFGAAAPAAGNDPRSPVRVSVREKEVILGEMRNLLRSVHGIQGAVAGGDYPAAAAWARKSGMAMETAVESGHPEILLKLPVEMKRLGLGTHEEFDRLAEFLETRPAPGQVLGRLNELTGRCVACHDTYRLVGE